MAQRWKLLALWVASALLAPSPAAAAPTEIAGLWRNGDHEAVIKLRACPDGLCGDFVRQPWTGAELTLVGGFRRLSDTRWEGGQVYDMNDGATYNVDLELLDAQNLRVRGCWLAICETSIWRRVR